MKSLHFLNKNLTKNKNRNLTKLTVLLNEKANRVYKSIEGENLNKYETNKLQHKKCFVRYFTRSLRSLVRFLIRQHLVSKCRTRALP